MSRNAGNLVALCLCAIAIMPGQSPLPPALTAPDARPEWLRDAKFGLFIRWGLYADPAGEWKGKTVAGPGEDIMRDARIPLKEYEEIAPAFNAAQFNAESWAKLAEEAGAKYVIFSAKDHDGFAMYQSAVSRYNIVDTTSFHRDPLKELAGACSKHHLKLGIYYSRSQDWHDPNGLGNDWDFAPDTKKDFDRYLRGKAEPQIRELLTGYGPIALLWFDEPRMMTPERTRRFTDLVHSLQPDTVIEEPMTNLTINETAGFKKFDNKWKSVDDLVFRMVDIVSKGGNYVLTIGPTAEGTVPSASATSLQSIGEWLKVNGGAVYGAGPSLLREEGGNQWRCTTKPGKIFITLFHWPESPLTLEHVPATIGKAYLLADESHAPLKMNQSGERVTVDLPADPPIEGEIPERMNPRFLIASLRAHTRTVLVLETASVRKDR